MWRTATRHFPTASLSAVYRGALPPCTPGRCGLSVGGPGIHYGGLGLCCGGGRLVRRRAQESGVPFSQGGVKAADWTGYRAVMCTQREPATTGHARILMLAFVIRLRYFCDTVFVDILIVAFVSLLASILVWQLL